MHVHFKDLNEFGASGHDVPWGTGTADAKGMMQELKRQGYRGYFSIEYERTSPEDLAKNLPLCVAFFDKTAAELAGSAAVAEGVQPWLGGWDLIIPGGRAGWLGVAENNGQLQASLLWGGGSVEPLASARLEGDQLVLSRGGKNGKTRATTSTITARRAGDVINLTLSIARDDGEIISQTEVSGRRTPPLPPAPDLSKVKFGEPITLFNGKDLTGWKVVTPNQAGGWSVRDGLLVNRVAEEPAKPHKSNLRTEREFEDFNLTLETARAQARQQRRLPSRHLRSASVGQLQLPSRPAQHGCDLQPHLSHRGRREAGGRVANT